MIASLNKHLNINAGGDYQQTAGQLLAKQQLSLQAANITFDTAINRQESDSHQSDLKIGQFTRVSSPLIDLIQTVESAVKNKDASDRVKAAQALGLAAKGYTAFTEAAAGGALIRVESGSGFSHKRETTDAMREFSLGNSVNANAMLLKNSKNINRDLYFPVTTIMKFMSAPGGKETIFCFYKPIPSRIP
ncbi:hypothetical protein [Rodentibacter sp. Ppn85]|uniref:hypothetical protein n=1 Tax=Rodentibacter sp. Ppn85 TaxID=1908525 RepID=UPI000985CBBF|nr:hypothetical protein [Rodentibacter sp. Ppn85]OOF61853.1 hypothetical protein BKL51_10320 [Rodentibacter sp. Ppn85]